jgi:DNA polymerase-3 subunit delta
MQQKDLTPEDVLKRLSKGSLAPFYLFYGPEEFRMEKTLNQIRETFVPAATKDFNLNLFYGGETAPAEIVSIATTLPFMSKNRLIIVRRTEEFKADQLEKFLPYLEKPVESSTVIFVTSATDFRKTFFKTLLAKHAAVSFNELRGPQIEHWIKQTAGELGLKMDEQACTYLQLVVGNHMRDLYAELEKTRLRFGTRDIGEEQVKELVTHSRIFNIFELLDLISIKNQPEALLVLNRFLEEEDKKEGPLKLIGMLNRQIRLLWQTKVIMAKGGRAEQVVHELGLHPFAVKKLMPQLKYWSHKDLMQALELLFQADGWLKSGMRSQPVIENLVMLLCDKTGSGRSHLMNLAAKA